MYNDINNLYSTLEINKNATHEEIKKAYRKLACVYHPDKNKDPTSSEKFVKIKTAYDILSNPETRHKYNTIDDKQEFFDLIIMTLQQYSKLAPIYFKKILSSIYGNNEYISDFNAFRFDKVFDKLLTNPVFHDVTHDEKVDIVEHISCDLADRYMDEYLYARIKRHTGDDLYKYISLKNDVNIFKGDGELDIDTGSRGDLKIHVDIKNKNGFEYVEHNLLKKMPIKKEHYDELPCINFMHIDNSVIKIDKREFSFQESNTGYAIIQHKGLPSDLLGRGDLIIELILLD